MVLSQFEPHAPAPLDARVAQILGGAAIPFIVSVIPAVLIKSWWGSAPWVPHHLRNGLFRRAGNSLPQLLVNGDCGRSLEICLARADEYLC